MIASWQNCVYGESFFQRPKRQLSLETFGLLRLGYPKVTEINRVPPVAAQHGVTLEEWRSLVQVALDFHIRGSQSVAIPRDMLRWIGYPGKPTLVIAPGREKSAKNQQFWPSARTAATRPLPAGEAPGLRFRVKPRAVRGPSTNRGISICSVGVRGALIESN